jgi:hypothetical protein
MNAGKFILITVGLDTWNSSSNSESVSGFQSFGVTFPLAIGAGSVSSAFGISYDRLVVVDQEGVIRHKGSTAAVNDAAGVSSIIDGLFTIWVLGLRKLI